MNSAAMSSKNFNDNKNNHQSHKTHSFHKKGMKAPEGWLLEVTLLLPPPKVVDHVK